MSINEAADNNIFLEKPALEKGGAFFKGLGESVEADTFRGDGCVSIPIFASKSRESAPDLNISYHSSWGNNIFGLGFRINAPAIFRKSSCKIPVYTDGYDSFTLDGEELILTKKEENIWIYTAEDQKNFQRIEFRREESNPFWKIISKDGVVSIYGKDETARISDPENNNIYKWNLQYSEDCKGNKTEYSYIKEDSNSYINNIRYGNYFQAGAERFAFEIKFDYKSRKDSFISHRSGFRIETKKLCRRISMVHHFNSVSKTVRETNFKYQEDKVSLLKEVSVQCYGYADNGELLECMTMPPVRFEYVSFQPEASEFEKIEVDGGVPANNIMNGSFRLADLYGEGIPGILYSGKEGVWYYEAAGGGRFKKPARIDEFPIDRDIKNSACTLKSLDGSGIYDLTVENTGRSGYYEQRDKTWLQFVPFEGCVNESNVSKISADIQGDKLSHLLFAENGDVKYYPSLKKKGYGMPVRVPAREDFPLNTRINSPYEKIFFTDIYGDGLDHCVKVSNGHIECWANLGYGRFDKKSELRGFSYIEDNFNVENIHFADINGLGAVDLIYIRPDCFDVYFNTGNGNFSPPVSFPLAVKNTNFVQVDFGDLMGNGTSCIMLTRTGAEVVHYYMDFCKKQKPYLMKHIDNGTGCETKLNYVSSVGLYLEDKSKGIEWLSTIPFPVFILREMRTEDKITGVSEKTEYFYRNPFYDNEEHKFIGFSASEETEYIYNYNENLSLSSDVCGVYKKRWYHSKLRGKYDGQFNITEETSYYPANCVFDVNAEYLPQAEKSLWGRIIREEIYLLNGAAKTLESIEHHNYTVRQCTVTGELKQSFFVYQNELIKYVCANSNIPAVTHDFILETDRHGNITKECGISYHMESDTFASVSCKTTDYAYTEKEKQTAGLPVGIKKYELNPSAVKKSGRYISFSEIRESVNQALSAVIPYGTEFESSASSARLFEWHRIYYWNETQSGALPFGEARLPALVRHTAKAVFPENFTDRVLGINLAAGEIKKQTGYGYESGYFWNCGVTSEYYGKEGFYLPRGTENVSVPKSSGLYSKTEAEYDEYKLMPVIFRSWVAENIGENIIKAEIDYDCGKYKKIIDFNDNTEEVMFYPSGMTRVYTKYGEAGGVRQGNKDLSQYKIQKGGTEDILKDPRAYLQGTSNYYFYDFNACEVIEIVNPSLNACLSDKIRVEITYKDGRGNTSEIKEQTESGWAVREYTVHKEKDKPFLRYKPFFSDSFRYDDRRSLTAMPDIYIYDGLSREIYVKKPAGFENVAGYVYTKKEYPAGRTVFLDENATVKDSSYYADFMEKKSESGIFKDYGDALTKAEELYGFRTEKIYDPKGNMTAQKTGGEDYFIYRYDINDNIVSIAESGGKRHMAYTYDMTGNRVKTVSCDMGTESEIFNIYDKPVYKLDGKGVGHYRKYDSQGRLTERYVDGIGTAERIIYGETAADCKKNNLRGQIYKYFDQAGTETNIIYDINNHVVNSARQLCADYRGITNWDGEVRLEEKCWTEEYKYDRADNIIWRRSADGSVEETFYDMRGLLSAKKIYGGGETKLSVGSIEYDAGGRAVYELNGNGIGSKFIYGAVSDNLEQVISQNAEGADVKNKRYIYDPAGNITRIRDLNPPASEYGYYNGQKATSYLDYKYDGLRRLTESAGRELPQSAMPADLQRLETYSEKYSYDISGNLLSVKHKSASTNWSREFDICGTDNRINKINGVSVTYDAGGNMEILPNGVRIAWNFDGLPVRADIVSRESGGSDSEYYVYDRTGRRIRKILEKKVNGNMTRREEKIYFSGFEISRIYLENDLICGRLSRYMIRDGARGAVWHSRTEGNGSDLIIYSVCDHIKSVNMETNGEGKIISLEEYYPYGDRAFINTAAREVSVKEYRYCSKEKDNSTGLYYYNSRYYDAYSARFISGDAFEYIDVDDRSSYNRYAYCKNNPVCYVDGDGHCPTTFTVVPKLKASDKLNPYIWASEEMGYKTSPTAMDSHFFGFDKDGLMYYPNPDKTSFELKWELMHGNYTYAIGVDEKLVIETKPEIPGKARYPHPCLIGGPNPTVFGAGMIHINKGVVTEINNKSGHFQPFFTSGGRIAMTFWKMHDIFKNGRLYKFNWGGPPKITNPFALGKTG